MLRLKRVVAILLMVSVVLTNNGMLTFADQLGEVIFETDENDKEDYSLGEQHENADLATFSNVLASNSENIYENEENKIDYEYEPEDEDDNVGYATLSETKEADLNIATLSETKEADLNIATESEISKATKTNIGRRLDDLKKLKDEYFGEDNFYANSNEWNKDQKQLFEFHKIREAWEYIYKFRNEEMKKRKVEVAVLDTLFAKPLADSPNISKDKDGNIKVWGLYNGDFYAVGLPSCFESVEKAPAEEKMKCIHGANVVSIIGERFNHKKDTKLIFYIRILEFLDILVK